MQICIPTETDQEETRVAVLPADAAKMTQLGAHVSLQAGIGRSLTIPDSEYENTGAAIFINRQASLSAANIVFRINTTSPEDIYALKEGCIYVSLMDPFNHRDLVDALCEKKISGISLEMIPRSTIAQKMDVLSSQANLAGYVAVILAAYHLKKIFPMMMTPAGTLSPVRVFVIGAGVAGLQAIATARRLGAKVHAFDVRPEAQEQISSVGATPLKIDIGQTDSTKQGYAKQLSDEQLALQRRSIAKQCSQSDLIITTAKVFGKKAPLIITNEMLDGMKSGSVVVDLAVEAGGNVEASKSKAVIDRNGVTIIGLEQLQRYVPLSASQMFSSNLYNFMEHFWDKENKKLTLDLNNEIIQGCLITHQGQIVHPKLKKN